VYEIDFHRVVPNFVIQAGDPTSTGSSGSTLGTFDDQFHVDLQHTSSGLLSYAKSSDDTNDSQWFVTDGPTRGLDFNHSIFGRLIEGEAVRDAINSVPGGLQNPDQPFHPQNNPNTRPIVPVVIKSITLVNNDTENGLLQLKAAEGASGQATVTIVATDQESRSVTQTITVNVTPDTSNGGPFLNDIPPQSFLPGQPIQFTITATDPENSPVLFNAVRPSGETVARRDGSNRQHDRRHHDHAPRELCRHLGSARLGQGCHHLGHLRHL
jgi:cyclophilin family peptidyl-prolyl cis-trans isomerase